MEVDIQLSTPVHHISTGSEVGLNLETESGTLEFDQVLVTTSPGLLAQIAPNLKADYIEGLLRLKSTGAVVMVLSLNQQLFGMAITGSMFQRMRDFPSLLWLSIQIFSLAIILVVIILSIVVIMSILITSISA